MRLYILSEVVLFGYMCVIFMLRQAVARIRHERQLEVVDPVVARLPLALRASRKALAVMHRLMSWLFHAVGTSICYDSLRLDVAYHYVARNVIEGDVEEGVEDDAALLNNIAQFLTNLAQDELELQPLALATARLSEEVQRKRQTASSA
jgi:hypothetical protein